MTIDKAASPRKDRVRNLANAQAGHRDKWIERNSFFYEEDYRYMRFLVPAGLSVLELGCGTGRLLSQLNPARGVGVDFSPRMVEAARERYPNYEFHVGDIEDINFISSLSGPFDVIILSDAIGSLDDCQATLSNLHGLCSPDTRIVIAYYSNLWEPILSIARLLNFKMPQERQNVLSPTDVANFLSLADFEVVRREWRQLLPRKCFGLGILLNRFLAPIPLIRGFCLRHYVVGRSLQTIKNENLSATVLVPCRNERGNIEEAVRRIPPFCADIEILFVEGHSKDDTLAEIHRVIDAYPHLDIKVLIQDGKGKGDAVRKGFENARGDVLMILDADLTMPPEALPKFYRVIASGKGEFVNGSRMIYPMEEDAMRFLNFLANHAFSWPIGTIAGTGLIDLSTSGYLTVGANNTSSSFDGAITGTGTLEKAGTGTLTFTSSISYAGTLDLSGGTLQLSNSITSIGTLNLTGNSTIDFAGSSTLSIGSLNLNGFTLNVINWVEAADYFYATAWAGATLDTRGVGSETQVIFNAPAFNGSNTAWLSYDNQITPVPEPSTYGALLLGSLILFFARRRQRA